MIDVIDLKKTFGDLEVLKGINVTINKGDIVVVIGPSGSGKSTFLRCLNLLEVPTTGQIIFEGTDITDKKVNIDEVRQRIGMVFQNFNLFPHMTVLDNMTIAPVRLLKTPRAQAEKQAMELLSRVGLADRAKNYPSQLSGGQKRRVALAGVLAMEPEVLVLDEPTAGLDPAGRENLMANIRDYHRNKGKTIILVSHSMDEIAQNVDRILVLKNAHVLMQGTPAEVFARGQELLSAGLDVPQITRIAMALKARGIALPESIYTYEQLKAALLELKGVDIC